MSLRVDLEQQSRDVRGGARDERAFAGADGAPDGTNGDRLLSPARAGPLIAALLAVNCTANVFSHLHDAAAAGRSLPVWQPIVWEATSAVSDLVACWIIWLALRFAPPSARRWLRCLLVNSAATLAFSAVHVAGMWILREIAYALAGTRYSPALSEVRYEYWKDLLAYVGFAAILWLGPRLAFAPPPSGADRAFAPGDACFDIQEGTRLLRIPIRDIVAVRAAGNYVEFLLRDGRHPLMRAPLGQIAATLEPAGFLRSHRSWIVNPNCVCALEPVGSGDYQVALDGGEKAPVSRRFPNALKRLKASN